MKKTSKFKTEPSPAAGPPEFFSRQVARARRFYLELSPPRLSSVRVVCGGVEFCEPSYSIERETFPFYSIEYVTQGRGRAILNRREFALQPGSVFSYGPGVSQFITGFASEPLVKYFVDFTGPGSRGLLARCGLNPGTTTQVYPPNTLQGIMEEVVESGLRTRSQAVSICSTLLQVLALKINAMRLPVESLETAAFIKYNQCRALIEDRCQSLRNLREVAIQCHISEPYLCRLFNRFGKESPYRYLTRLKMNRAAELLQTPGIMVRQVALEVGMQDALHFSRVFKKCLGISPEQFRKLR